MTIQSARNFTPSPQFFDGSGTKKVNLLGIPILELESAMENLGLPKFRARQIWRWIWRHGLKDFENMSDIGKDLRQLLVNQFTVDRPEISSRLVSVDGTIKWLLRFADGNEAECVYIPEKDRGTLCISSQIGCSLSCTFCHTGTQKIVRNLEVEEICGQVERG